ncbi:MAG TPA: TonB-dependent receptor [Polyangiaceae bacterium]|nr:TonB-dependent receptor [Polyangiaceae bacterium]
MGTRRRIRAGTASAVAALGLACVLAAPRVALADDVADEADLAFRIGAERYAQGDFKGALEHFLASNRLAPNQNVVFNVAKTYEKLERYPEAFRYYSAALAGETDAGARERIGQALEQIRPHVAVLAVETEPPGATLYVDRKDLGARGESPRALGVPAGRYKVLAELPGYYPGEADVESAPVGQTTRVTIALRPILGRLSLDGAPVGARVRIDDPESLPRCVLPCSVELSPGHHVAYVAQEGYRTSDVVLDVTARETTTSSVRLQPLVGTVVVTTDEPGAVVNVDGKASGFSPAILTLPVGAHRVSIALRGYRTVERAVDVAPDKQSRLDLVLTQAQEVEAASRVSESVDDAPSSVTVIPREEILAFGYPTIAEALRGVRGVYLWNDRAYQSIGIRGLGRLGSYGNRELVLQDGEPTNDDWVGSAYVGFDGRSDLGDVDHIELVRGPGSVLYGTNAFSGVVNVVTRGRDERPGGEAGVSAVDAGVTRGRVRAQASLGKDAGIWASISGAHGAGRDFAFAEMPNRSGEASPSRDADAFAAGTLSGRVWWKWLTLQWFAHSHDKELPTGEFDTLLSDPRSHQQDTRAFAEARAEPKLSEFVQLYTRVHLNFYRFRGDYSHTDPASGLEQDGFDGRWVGAEQRVVLTPLRGLRATLGGEGQYHFQVDTTARDASGLFLNQSGTTGRPYEVGAVYGLLDAEASEAVRLSGGVRLDAYSTSGSSLNPRAAVILRPYAAGNLKILGGTAFRAPSVYELYYNDGGTSQVASPDLRPEKIYSAEIEHTHRFSPTVTGIASVFANYATNLIVARDITSDLFHYENVGTPLLSTGVEIALRREWRRGFMLEASYSFQHSAFLASTKASDLFSLRTDPSVRHVANSPEHLGAIKAAAPLLIRGVTAATRLTFEGPRWDRYESVGDPAQGKTPAVVVWDLVVSGHEDKYGLRWTLGAYNLGGYRYSLPASVEFVQRSILQNGRTLLASVDVAF